MEQSTRPLTMTNTTAMTTAATSSMTTSHEDKMERLHEARTELIAAAAVLSLITVAAVALIVIKIRNGTSDNGNPEATDLTYREHSMPKTDPASTTLEGPVTATKAEETTGSQRSSTAAKKRVLDAYPLLCTYGMQTNQSTLFPDDGLCDLIFFDSACKDNTNLLSLPSSFSENMNTFLSAAPSYRRTDFGVAFAYEYRFKLRVDLKVTHPDPLEELWKRGIGDFGIVDMPAFGVKYNDIQDTFTTLKELNAVAERKPDAVRPPHIVLGAVPLASVDDYASKMKNLFTPTLFISQGHYAFGDSHVPFCHVTPPTLLQKGVAWRDYPYDLTEAVAALKKIKDDGGSAKLLVSVGMKSRSSVTKLNEPSMYTAPCIYDFKAQPFKSYVEICTDSVWRSRLQYNNIFIAMYAVDQSDNKRFVYDDEYSLCQKMCSVKGSFGHHVRFGIAVYDLEYEDYANKCSWLNKFGAFTRLKMVRKIVDYFRNSEQDDLRECLHNLSCDAYKYAPRHAG